MTARSHIRPVVHRPHSSVQSIDHSFTVEAERIFAAMAVKADLTLKARIDALIIGLKQDDIWDDLDILYAFKADSSQFATLNWKKPWLFTATASGTVTFTGEAVAGNGVDSLLSLNWNAQNHAEAMQQDDACIFVYSNTSAQQSAVLFGGEGSPRLSISPRNTSDQLAYRVNQSAATTIAGVTDGSGLFAVDRTGATATQSYRNGSVLGAAGSVTSTGLSPVNLAIGRYGSGYTDAQARAAGAGRALGATKHAALYARLSAYLNAA